jgi:hypothetical protein
MPGQSPKAISINPNLRCDRTYPTETSLKTVANLKTVGFKLTKIQAVDLARVLLAVTQD